MGSTPHSVRPDSRVNYHAVKNESAGARPPPTMDADDARIDIERLGPKLKCMTAAAMTVKSKSPLSRPAVRHETEQEQFHYYCPVKHGDGTFYFALSQHLRMQTDPASARNQDEIRTRCCFKGVRWIKSKKENRMKMTAGLWIDHRKAVIAIVSGEGETTLEIRSNVEKQPGRFAGVRSTKHYGQQVPADDSHEKEFTGHLNQYYAEVIASIRDAESILLFGPGEAKGELKQRLERDKLGGHIIAMETVDKMTDRQIAAKVREYFHQ